mgnify:CR=1 FL=1
MYVCCVCCVLFFFEPKIQFFLFVSFCIFASDIHEKKDVVSVSKKSFYITSHFFDTVAERLRRTPAKCVGNSRAGSNPAGVALFFMQIHKLMYILWFVFVFRVFVCFVCFCMCLFLFVFVMWTKLEVCFVSLL